jgi:tetratricopeptide (TPR) repeat protein
MAEDEAATIRTLTAYREQVTTLVQEHRGRLADFTGDNFLAEFPTALDAVQGAVEIQRVIQARNADLPDDRRIFRPVVMGYLAEVYLELGDPERAGALAEEAVEAAQRRGAPLAEQSSLLSLSRVLLRSQGAEAWDTAATAIERALARADQTGLVVLVPQFLVERAELARLRGEHNTCERELREAHRLYTEMGATGHARRLARELGLEAE